MAKPCTACKHAKPVHYSRSEIRDPRCTHPDLVMYGQLFEGAPLTRFYLTQREARGNNACGVNAALWSAK
jgi:hypothetical protein